MKKNFLKVGVALTMVSALVLGSCGKYEEGPGFSLRTKTARLAGVWDVKEYESSNGTVTTDTDASTVEYTKDNTMIVVIDGLGTINGTWEFGSDKETLVSKVTFLGQTDVETSTIVRLTNSELWTKDSDGDITKSVKK